MTDMNVNNSYLGKGVNSDPSTFRKVMNPESYAINSLFDAEGDEAFKSYLNPLCPYSQDENGQKITNWTDPLMKTIDANIGGTHFQNLNPIHNTISKEATTDEKIKSWVDPGMACATSFIKNEKAANAVYTIFNPVGGIVTGLAKGIVGLFKKD